MRLRWLLCLALLPLTHVTSVFGQVYIPRPNANIAWIREHRIHSYTKKIESIGESRLSSTEVSRYSIRKSGILTERTTRIDALGDSIPPGISYLVTQYDRKNRKIYSTSRTSWSHNKSWQRYKFLDDPKRKTTTVFYRSNAQRKELRFVLYYDDFDHEIASSQGSQARYDSAGRLVLRMSGTDSMVNFYHSVVLDSEQYYKLDVFGWHYWGGRRYVRDTMLHRDSEFFWFNDGGKRHSQVSTCDSVTRETFTFDLNDASDTTHSRFDNKWRMIDSWYRDSHWHDEYPIDTDTHSLTLKYLNGKLIGREEELYE